MDCEYNAFYMNAMARMMAFDKNMDFATRKIIVNALRDAAEAHEKTGCTCIQKNREQMSTGR